MIVMAALATLGSLTVVSVQSSLKTSTNDRAQAIAMYAAESGAAAAMELLRRPASFSLDQGWSALLKTGDANVVPLAAPVMPTSGAQPGTPENVFTIDQNAWYEVELHNNRDDPGFHAVPPAIIDMDGRLIIRSTGHGPQGSLAIIEVEVARLGLPKIPDPPAPPPALPPPWHEDDVKYEKPLMLLSWHVVL